MKQLPVVLKPAAGDGVEYRIVMKLLLAYTKWHSLYRPTHLFECASFFLGRRGRLAGSTVATFYHLYQGPYRPTSIEITKIIKHSTKANPP